MPSSPEAIFVVLSDLHFGDDLLQEANGPLQTVPWWLRIVDGDIKRYFDKRCKAHDVSVLKSLPRYLRSLLREYRDAGFAGDNFDLYLLLGDHATLPTESSYRFLREYLTSWQYKTGNSDLEHRCAGLNVPAEKLILIPGNHDKMLMTDLGFYQHEVLKKLGLPPDPNKQSLSFRSRTIRDRRFVFLLLDASKYASANDCLDFSCRQHLAGGEITPELKAAIVTRLEKLKKGETVDGISPEEYANATRILLVHYAVDGVRVCGPQHSFKDLILPHECSGLGQLVEELSDQIQLVVHGHLHQPKLYRHGTVPVVAATTTTQRGGENGFFLLKFFASGEIAAEHHLWLKTGFLVDSRAELNQTLGRANAAP